MSGLAEFGALIKRARESKKWTQMDLANRMERPHTFLVRIETGKNANPPDPHTFDDLSRLLDIPKRQMLEALGYLDPHEPDNLDHGPEVPETVVRALRALTWDEDHLREIGRSKRRGAYTPESDATVSEIVDAYIERGAHRWSSNTVATYKLLAKQQIAPTLGKVRMVALTTPQVQRWVDKLTAMTLSASVIENARTVLSGACKEAMQMGMIRVSPVTGTRVPARKRTAKTIWTPDDVARVLDAVKGDVLYLPLGTTKARIPVVVGILACFVFTCVN